MAAPATPVRSYLKDQVDFSTVQRVLVVKLQHLGDVLLTTPVFAALKQAYPHLQIDALVFADTAPLLADNPHINRIFTIDKAQQRRQGWRKLGNEWRLLRGLRAQRYQLLIALTDRWRAALLARLLRPRYSVAQLYPQKRGAFWQGSFTHLYRVPQTPRHTVETHLDALRRLGLYPDAAIRRLQIGCNAAIQQQMLARLTASGLKAGTFVVLHPTSRWMFKSWNVAGFAETLRLLHQRGIAVLLVSGPADSEIDYAKAVAAQAAVPVIDWSGQLSLADLTVLIAEAGCFIGLDSVAMHIAAAVGTPCVALFGPSDERLWGPWQVSNRVLASTHSCRPCQIDGCGNGKISDCLQALQAAQVADAALALLAEPAP